MENKKSDEKNNNRMEFGMRIARRSILEEINNGCSKNLVFSPLSLHIALNMLASGSTGQTLEQLLHFLESDGITHLNAQSSRLMELATGDTHDDLPQPPDDSIHQNPTSRQRKRPYPFDQNQFPQSQTGRGPYSSNQNKFPGNRSCRENGPLICLVNGIWVDKKFSLKHSYKQLAEDIYKVDAQSVDFLNQAEQVTEEINSWAKEASKGHISPLFNEPINKDSILVLANALYFKGTWVDSFDPLDTEDEDFHLFNGETVRVPFMKKAYTYNFCGSFEGFDLLKMGYKSGRYKEYAMYIFLPHKYDGLRELVVKFNSDPRFFLENRELQKVKLNKLWLPKLKYEFELDSLKSMKELGLTLPFDEVKAELKMVETSEVVYVSKAIQKAYIEVNEEGTIATAVTRFVMGPMGRPCWEPFELNFVADHPFLFMIKEEVSTVVLFVGAALNPLS